jgi:GrpB-like predicted nucleotidyltransferase (UPF0157 family)
MSEWPAWATEPVRIEDWSPAWAAHAAELIDSLQDVLDEWLAGPIHHVGSTAVPHLPAKPVIDLLATVPSIAVATSAHGALDEAGWSLVPPELDERPWRRTYVLPGGDRRIAHLHLVDVNHERAHHELLFRDRLREDADLANRYAQLKKAAAKAHRDDREAYTAAKTDFVREVVDATTSARTRSRR